ncbi:MAG TPA: glycine-rich protein [Ottowia sp.]|nr:glycine-rich protein [Ottowia sp.]
MRIKSKIALAAVAWAAASAALGATANFAYTGAAQTWTVPAGVTQVTLDLRGAQGGASYVSATGLRQQDGGLGGQTQGSLSVTPGQVLNLYVGGQAADVGNVTPAPGGFNGGGDGGVYGAGGGGATDVRVGGTALANRVAVAGGGGGGNSGCPNHGTGGAGGGASGVAGVGHAGYTPGGGGTQSAGGAAGYSPGVAGQLGLGGSSASYHMAGGGGGYYGGGSAYAAGGGGGSGYIGGLGGGTTTAGVQAGHGSIVITYDVATAPTPVPTLETGVLALLGAALAALGAAGAARRRRG